MILQAKLPEKSLWIPRQGTAKYKYAWESKHSHRLQVRSEFQFDWDKPQIIAIQENRGRGITNWITRIDLRVLPKEKPDKPSIPVLIDYQHIGGIIYSLEPTLKFYAIANSQKENRAIALSIIKMN